MQDNELNIYLAHGNDGHRKVLEANLELLTHKVELTTTSPAVLLRRCEENPPAIAIVGSCFEGTDCFDVLNDLSRRRLCPVLAILQFQDVDRSRRLIADQVMGVLVEPVNERDLRTAIYLARRRFDQSQAMKRKIGELESELQDLGPTRVDGGEATS